MSDAKEVEQFIQLLQHREAKDKLAEAMVELVEGEIISSVREQAAAAARAEVAAAMSGEADMVAGPRRFTPRRSREQQRVGDCFDQLQARLRPLSDFGTTPICFDSGTGAPEATGVVVLGGRAAISGTNLHGVTRLVVGNLDVSDFVLVNSGRIEFDVPDDIEDDCVYVFGDSYDDAETELRICESAYENYVQTRAKSRKER